MPRPVFDRDPMPRTATRSTELIVLLGLLAALGPLSIDTYLPSTPAIAREFDVAAALVQHSVSVYFLGLAAGLVVCGPLSDRVGRRPVLFAGLALYLAATLACVLARDVHALVAARVVQGLGASAAFASTPAIVRDLWSGNRAARVMSIVMMVMAFAPLLAPLIGAQIFVRAGWRAVFGLMFGFGVLLVALVWLRLPETNGRDRRGGVRIAALFGAYGRVLASARAWAYLLAGGLAYATLFAYITGVPFVYIGQFGVEPQHFGFLFGLNVVGLVAGNALNSRFVTRFGHRRMLAAGAMVSFAGVLALLASALAAAGGIAAIVATLFVAIGPVSMMGANAVAGLLDLYPRNAGAASALFGVCQNGFGALAGGLAGALYRGTPVAMATAMAIVSGGALLASLALGLMHARAVERADDTRRTAR